MNSCGSRSAVSFKNVVYATDFSPSADAALPYALSIAGRYSARLHALRVRRPSPLWFMGMEAACQMIETEQQLANKDATRLHAMLATVPHDVAVEEGDFWLAFEEIIERYRIDLIVTGTRGRSGLAKGLLGSVAESILRRAACPVLTVGPLAGIDGTQEPEFREILFATDLSSISLTAAKYAISLAEKYRSRLTLLHVLAIPKAGDLVRPMDYASTRIHQLRDLIPIAVEFWQKPTYMVKEGSAADRILEVAEEKHADLIILGAKDAVGHMVAATHLPGATAHQVIVGAACAVLTVRRKNC
jgi:nucleotide-binding universal stress UspA family protein